jgi:hypothetical protein
MLCLCSHVGISLLAGTRVGEGRRKFFGENFEKKRWEPRASTSFLESGLKSWFRATAGSPAETKTERPRSQVYHRDRVSILPCLPF